MPAVNDAVSRLLIVDDDPELLRFLMEELDGAGHQCIGCDNGQDALLRWRQESFDLVVLDWTLPDFSGVELCRRLRASNNTAAVLRANGKTKPPLQRGGRKGNGIATQQGQQEHSPWVGRLSLQ